MCVQRWRPRPGPQQTLNPHIRPSTLNPQPPTPHPRPYPAHPATPEQRQRPHPGRPQRVSTPSWQTLNPFPRTPHTCATAAPRACCNTKAKTLNRETLSPKPFHQTPNPPAHLCEDCAHAQADHKERRHPAGKLLGKHPPVDALLEALHETHTHDASCDALGAARGQAKPAYRHSSSSSSSSRRRRTGDTCRLCRVASAAGLWQQCMVLC
jgi:hypothetical protein